ncbi:MAG: aldehyde ferredoxin oxidoreductase N-terminal domain-containing protein [Thiobacillaceae bacterium]
MFGYMGRLLFADLSSGRLWDEPLAETEARAFVGGSGLAARLVWQRVDETTDPLGPDSPLVFMTGPLVGTAMPSAGRYSVGGAVAPHRALGRSQRGRLFRPRTALCRL